MVALSHSACRPFGGKVARRHSYAVVCHDSCIRYPRTLFSFCFTNFFDGCYEWKTRLPIFNHRIYNRGLRTNESRAIDSPFASVPILSC
jgi:hypothetical protein